MNDKIIVKGARENNLKNIDITLPKNKLIVMTGVSGSGKSSLAFDTIFQEGERRFIESLSSIVPGVSGTMLLMTIGTYNIVINIISNLTNINFIINNISLILIFLFGTLLGIIITSLMMKNLLNKHKNSTYSCILGICIANIIILIIKIFQVKYTFIELIIGLIMAIIGYVIGTIL